ncbi:trypsin-like peptidase domain-containing protein [Pontimicrobium sp. IMCC45349]|uniref:trypsin-like peptidase domain-containing protein n=1 Tax=Pontimicrobium sp. IMCC45349 TaxID=3391574 RepID=UPI00399F9019
MKKILSLMLVSALGGALTLGTYKLFIEKENSVVLNENTDLPITVPVNLNTTNTKLTTTNVDFSVAAEKTIHSVVHVKNTTISKGYTSFEDLFMGRPSQRAQVGTGSGVIISPDGYIITNNHVIEGAQSIAITMNDNKTFEAQLVGTDPTTDIALLKIDANNDLPYTTFGDSDSAKIGEWVLAVGNPFNLTSTVTAGIISAKARDLSGKNTQSFIQTDAAVNPGNSGGALVNTNGDLIGINTAISSQTGSYIGYSFAVPSNIARKVVEDIMEFGNVQNGVLGVSGGSLNSINAEDLGVTETEGFYINNVDEDSGAAKAGLKSGDIIKEIDGIKISKFADLKGFLGTKSPEDVVYVTLLRDGNTETIPVTLAKNNSTTFPTIGILKNATTNDLKKYNLDYGVKISAFTGRNKSYWQQYGVEEGTIVTAINGIKIKSVDDVERIKSERSPYDALSIELINSDGERERYRFK